MEERLNAITGGVKITRFNYNRPKWFGGFFGDPLQHNKSGNCRYNEEEMKPLLNAERLNELVQDIYTMTPVLAYHLAITIFCALSVVLTLMQQFFNYLIEFGFVQNADPNQTYLHALGIIWYIVWGVGLVTIIPLYYVSVNNIERYFMETGSQKFQQLGVRVKINKNQPSKFLIIDGFKKIDSLQISAL